MPSSLRNANAKDAPLLAEIHSRAYRKAWSASQMLDSIVSSRVLLAGAEGFIIFEIVIDECELKMVAVLPEAQRLGLALQMCREMITECARQKVARIFLEVEETNLAAIKLYQKLGFVTFSRRKNYYGENRNALLMGLQMPQETAI